jgi:uncharacterized protein
MLSHLLTALALVLVVEGVLYALAPSVMKGLMAQMQNMPDDQLRFAGLVVTALGVIGVWLSLGH